MRSIAEIRFILERSSLELHRGSLKLEAGSLWLFESRFSIFHGMAWNKGEMVIDKKEGGGIMTFDLVRRCPEFIEGRRRLSTCEDSIAFLMKCCRIGAMQFVVVVSSGPFSPFGANIRRQS